MSEGSPKLDIYEVLEAHLQPSEVIKIATRCKSVQTPDVDTFVAVISNVQNDHDAEQAALLSVEVPKGQAIGRISGICPIFSDYTFTIEAYEDSPSGAACTLEAAGKPMQASFKVKFNSDNGNSTLNVITDEIAALGDLMKETKRLADVAAKYQYNPSSPLPSHNWLSAYSVTSPDGISRAYVVPRKQDSFTSLLSSYGSKALEGLPSSLSTTLGSFSFLGRGAGAPPIVPPKLPPRRNVKKVFDAEPDFDEATESKLRERRHEYVNTENLRIHVATFNANGQFYDMKQNLATWLRPEEQPDVLVIGLQEMDLRPEVLMVRHDTTVGHAWVAGVLACLNDGTDGETKKGYQCLEMKQLAGLYIACFVNSALVRNETIKDANATSVMTGWAGFAGNKGACGIRLRLSNDRSICFVTAHLAAFQDNVERRNADYRDICTRMVFPPTGQGAVARSNSLEGSLDDRFYPTIFDSDVLFFFGDLNYRIDLSMENNKALLEKKAYKEMLEHDQLKKAQKSSLTQDLIQSLAHAFEGFEEAEIDFQPTYKYDKGSDTYDSSEKERKPAYTDRILWYSSRKTEGDDGEEKVQVACKTYTSAMDVQMSDHKPVIAIFDVTIPIIDKQRRTELLRELASNTNEEET